MENLLALGRSFIATHRVLICLGIVAGFASLAYGVLNQSAIPPYVQELGLTAHIGLIYAAFLVTETIFKSPMGALSDRLGRRPIIILGSLIACATALGMTFAQNLAALLVLRAFDGLAAALIWPTMIAALGGCSSKSLRATSMSVLTVAYISGLALGPLLGGIVNDLTNSRLTSFYLISGLFLATAVIAFVLTPNRSKEDMESNVDGKKRFRLGDLITGIKAVPEMVLLAFGAFFAIGLLVPIVKLFAMNQLGMSETGYGTLVLPIALVIAGVSLISGRLGDRWGKVRSVRLGIGISAMAMWGFTVLRTPWELAAVGMFIGIGFVLAMPAWLAFISDMAAPWARGAVIGAMGTAQGVGAICGASLGSYLFHSVSLKLGPIDVEPNYSPFVISAMALTLCFAVAMGFMRESGRRRIGDEVEPDMVQASVGE